MYKIFDSRKDFNDYVEWDTKWIVEWGMIDYVQLKRAPRSKFWHADVWKIMSERSFIHRKWSREDRSWCWTGTVGGKQSDIF